MIIFIFIHRLLRATRKRCWLSFRYNFSQLEATWKQANLWLNLLFGVPWNIVLQSFQFAQISKTLERMKKKLNVKLFESHQLPETRHLDCWARSWQYLEVPSRMKNDRESQEDCLFRERSLIMNVLNGTCGGFSFYANNGAMQNDEIWFESYEWFFL